MPLNSLAGQLLVAMPQMQDHRFVRSVIYLCLHNQDGAMGLVLNKVIGSLTLPELLMQLKISSSGLTDAPRIHFRGPVESGPGFGLHSAAFTESESLVVRHNLALTTTPAILRAIRP